MSKLLVFFSCITISACNSKVQPQCKLDKIQTLFTTPGIYEGKITGYGHDVLIENFSRKCLDSATMVNIALKYRDTVKVGVPAQVIMFYNSIRNFNLKEISQENEINKDCLVKILFDEKKGEPYNFIFYDEKGNQLYWGDRWLPQSP